MPDTFVCGKCGKVAKTKQALERHAAYHEDDRPFSCEVCLQRFKNSDDRGKHYRRLKKDGKFTIACTVCHKHFKTEDILKKHIEMLGCKVVGADVTKRPNVASAVDKDITDGAVIPKEESVPGDGINCTCKICETEFISATTLKKHYREIHNDVKRQVCIQCGQTLSSKDSLARHFSIFHQTSFPYSCEECHQKFKIKESLCRHVKFVHQDGGYQCPECHRLFSQPVNLKKHLAVHSNQKEFACKYCGREFRWKQALQKHEYLHEVQGNGSKGEKTLDIANNLNTDSDRCSKTDIELPDDANEYEDIPGNEIFQSAIERNSPTLMLENIHSETFESTSRQKSESNGKHLKTNVASHKIFIGNESSRSLENQNKPVNKNFNKFDFHDEDDDLGDILSCKNEPRKRTSSQNVTHSPKKKKFEIVEDMLADKHEGSYLLAEDNHGSSVKLKTLVEDRLDQQDKCGALQNEIPCFEAENGKESLEITRGKHNEKEDMDEFWDDTYENRKQNGKKPESETKQSDKRKERDDDVPQGPKYSELTSFPTDKTKDAPKLVFKPSAIPNILAGPEEQPKETIDASSNGRACDEPVHSSRKPMFRFPSTCGSLQTKLHNPFIIPNDIHRIFQHTKSAISKEAKRNEKDETTPAPSVQETLKSIKSPSAQIIPHGKFSLVKHMLSLQNEENFDKAIFENPLYNKPANVKEFEQMAERHRVTDKSDNSIVQSYDLSAKQNIPFHWLGMSVTNRKGSIKDSNEMNDRTRSSSERTNNAHQKDNEILNDNTMENNELSSKEHINEGCLEGSDGFENINGYSKASDKDSNGEHDSSCFQERVHHGFQAIKDLVANRQLAHKEESIGNSKTGISVLTNPFDYENVYFQEKATDLSRNNVWTPTLRVPSQTNIQDKVHSIEKSTWSARTAEEKKHMYNLNRAADNEVLQSEKNVSKHVNYSRQYSLDSFSKHFLPSHKLDISPSKSYFGSSVATGSSASTGHFSRSLSIPCPSDFRNARLHHRTWSSDSAIPMEDSFRNTSNEHRLFPENAELSQSFPFSNSGNPENPLGSQNGKDIMHATTPMFQVVKDIDLGSERESWPDIRPDRQTDLMMLSKHVAQVQKLTNGKQHDATRTNHGVVENIKNNEANHRITHMNDEQFIHNTGHTKMFKTFSSRAPDNQKIEKEVDNGSSFDAYNFIHSPFRPNVLPSPDTTHDNIELRSDYNDLKTNQVPRCGSSTVGKPHVVTRNVREFSTTDFERRHFNSRETERDIQDFESRDEDDHSVAKKKDISIFDILKGQEDKVKDFDNIDTLLGTYS